VFVPSLGDIVFELPLALEGLLRNIAVCPETRPTSAAVLAAAAREGKERSANLAVNDVVPILKPESECVHCRVGNGGVYGKVCKLQSVGREIAGCQILKTVRLVIETVVALRGVADIRGVLGINQIIETAIVTRLKKRSRDDGGGLCAERRRQLESGRSPKVPKQLIRRIDGAATDDGA
jgi:ABC-type phosphate transport system auxiliary subunit